jgi:hypothetical protein
MLPWVIGLIGGAVLLVMNWREWRKAKNRNAWIGIVSGAVLVVASIGNLWP